MSAYTTSTEAGIEKDLRPWPCRHASVTVFVMSMNRVPLDQSVATESHELDWATCLWLLPSEQVGRVVALEPERVVVQVNYVMVGDAVIVRVDAASVGAAWLDGAPVAFDVAVLDIFSQVGWAVHVRGDIERITHLVESDDLFRKRLRPWMRQPDDQWFRISITDVSGRWFRPAEQPPVFDPTGFF